MRAPTCVPGILLVFIPNEQDQGIARDNAVEILESCACVPLGDLRPMPQSNPVSRHLARILPGIVWRVSTLR